MINKAAVILVCAPPSNILNPVLLRKPDTLVMAVALRSLARQLNDDPDRMLIFYNELAEAIFSYPWYWNTAENLQGLRNQATGYKWPQWARDVLDQVIVHIKIGRLVNTWCYPHRLTLASGLRS